MEKHKCKLCFKSFSNGRALGGHMRSHMMNLPIPPKPEQPITKLGEETESASSSAASSEGEEAAAVAEEEKGLYYGLRENPKKNSRFADPEFSFPVDATSVVLQDRESETESSKNPTRRRSKRIRKSGIPHQQYFHQQEVAKLKYKKQSKAELWAEPEPVSSISDTTTEEDVAYCLMMLSRDKWSKQSVEEEDGEEEEEDDDDEDDDDDAERYENVREIGKFSQQIDGYDSDDLKSCKTKARGKYRCETCKKLFRSYQALGGHRASHKKLKLCTPPLEAHKSGASNAGVSTVDDQRSHECPVCFRVFSSGQALGGHKRSHLLNSATPTKSTGRFGDNLIDLNLPAPIDDEDISQVELSAVSDSEFVNPIKR